MGTHDLHLSLIFRLRAHHFHFRAIDSIYFPPGKAGNVLRGALGTVAWAPESTRPSGLADPPRPFVLRAAHLDGKRCEPGQAFSLGVNVFDPGSSLPVTLAATFSEWARTGLGPRRGRVELLGSDDEAVAIPLAGGAEISQCSLLFRTPTELKGNPDHDQMPFGILFARVRDRISTLCTLYGEGPLPIDFRGLADRAALVHTVNSDLQYSDVWRRSSRTGAAHRIGGVMGRVDYEGNLTEFLPYLRAAWWTGVGRHTVWGNGVIEVVLAE
jgi:hypothetical protein